MIKVISLKNFVLICNDFTDSMTVCKLLCQWSVSASRHSRVAFYEISYLRYIRHPFTFLSLMSGRQIESDVFSQFALVHFSGTFGLAATLIASFKPIILLSTPRIIQLWQPSLQPLHYITFIHLADAFIESTIQACGYDKS